MRAESFHLFRPEKLCLRCPTTNYHATTESAGSAGGGGGELKPTSVQRSQCASQNLFQY